MAEDLKRAIDIDTLSHFKAKQDLENERKFKKKDDASDLKGAVLYNAAQALTEQEKAQARLNIGAAAPGEGGGGGGTVEGAVRYDVALALDEDDKARARENIGTTDGTWENMPDKPFYKTGLSYDWDGNTEGRESFNVVEAFDFYKVSSETPTKEELVGATAMAYFDGSILEGEIGSGQTIDFLDTDNGNIVGLFNGELPMFFIISVDGEDIAMGEIEINFPSTGIYFFRAAGEEEYTHYIKKNYSIKKIDKEFLPDDINVELPDGLVTTDENGLIPASMLPSYVDDVVEGRYMELGEESSHFQTVEGVYINPESGKIYVDLNTGNTYRWSGSVYVRMNPDKITFATNDDINALFN